MYNKIDFQNLIDGLQIKKNLTIFISILCFLFISFSCFAYGWTSPKTIVNPLWKGNVKLPISSIPVTGQNKGSFQSLQNVVSSYDEFETVLFRNMRERKTSITINLESSRSSPEIDQWNNSLWGATLFDTNKGFYEIPWLCLTWESLTYTNYLIGQDVSKIKYDLTYPYDASQEKEFEDGLLATMQQIISPDMDIIAREKIIHDWIVNHVDYDNATLTGNDDLGYTDYSAFVKGTAVCEGYAILTNRMMFMAGITNLIVSGTATGGDHAWNMVKLGNDWYQLDTTWDDMGLYGDHNIRYKYFNITDGTMSADHTWDETAYPNALQTFDASQYQGEKNNDQCSIFQPNLCNNEIDCIKIDGTWDNGSCTVNYNANPQCPVTQSCLQFESSICDSSSNCKQTDVFHENDKFKIKLNIDAQSSDISEHVDLYIGIMCPDGTLLFFTSDPYNSLVVCNGGNITSNMAYKQNIEQTSQDFTLFNFTVTQNLQGAYKFYALFEKAGKPLDLSSLLSNLAYKEIVFNN